MYDYLMLDIGGSFVKHAAMKGEEFCLRGSFPLRESGTAEDILVPIVSFIRENPSGTVVLSMPGPMDYLRGTSLMKHKFAALHGLSIKEHLAKAFPGIQTLFLHDAAAFMLGEMAFGAARGCAVAAGVMLGTGLGFVLCRDGKALMLQRRSPAYPLWNAPYGDGIAEDYVSARAIRRRWEGKTGTKLDVREISELARQGHPEAADIMADTGMHLGRILTRHLKGHGVERVVMGGQVSKSLDLMLPSIARECGTPVFRAEHIDDAPLWGAYVYALRGDALLDIQPDEYWERNA